MFVLIEDKRISETNHLSIKLISYGIVESFKTHLCPGHNDLVETYRLIFNTLHLILASDSNYYL